MKTPVELWRDHVAEWSGCELCELHLTRTQVVLGRGQVPCDVLFIGFAPGRSEDVLGKPFVGPAGKMQDEITAEALNGTGLRVAYGNLVCCLPPGEAHGIRNPTGDEIEACSDRLREMVSIFRPRLLVAVGSIPRTWLPKLTEGVPIVSIDHPSNIIREPATSGHKIERSIVVLKTAAKELLAKRGA